MLGFAPPTAVGRLPGLPGCPGRAGDIAGRGGSAAGLGAGAGAALGGGGGGLLFLLLPAQATAEEIAMTKSVVEIFKWHLLRMFRFLTISYS
jgi:hypothetical protein